MGGHSKGGNLAVYAAMKSKKQYQERLVQIYNNDGPGICKEMIDEEGYRNIKNKTIRIVPGFSVIGMLFAPEEKPVIVKSSGYGLRHD